MIKQALAALLVTSVAQFWTLPASAFNRTFALAIMYVERNPTPTQRAVVSSVDGGVSLDALVRVEVIRTPYDCPPEFRVSCLAAILNVAGSGTTPIEAPEEWGEWRELPTVDDFVPIAAEWGKEAIDAGFNLLLSEEISASIGTQWRE